MEIVIVSALIGLLAAIAVPGFLKSRSQSQQTVCVRNLVVLDEAVEQWALQSHKKTGDPVVEDEVFSYLKKGKPHCPAGGTYGFNTIGESTAWCSFTSGDTPHSTNAPPQS
ncbi:MAG: hypothetical protein JWM68_5795 [Verrucomicrobiales bacterium]|nr:hypothetical protein [Verrucomicrobiales bacterium]